MDSLTQALLGAATFSAVMDRHIGKKALLIGAAAGTLPDLDVVLSPIFSDAAFMTVHRSVSHSIVLAVVLSLILGAAFYWLWKKKHPMSSWLLAFFISIFSHALLDWCTTYGTRILSPFHDHAFSLNIIHVFEPVYTFILFVVVGRQVVSKRSTVRTTILGLVVSTMYLMWAGTSKMMVMRHAKEQIKAHDIYYSDMVVSPTPLNTVLWNIIVRTEGGYYFANHSLFDNTGHIDFQFVESEFEAIKGLEDIPEIKYYLQYCDEFPLVVEDDEVTRIYAAKFGPVNYSGEPEFVMPLCISKDEEPRIWIDSEMNGYGPVKSWRRVWNRLFSNPE